MQYHERTLMGYFFITRTSFLFLKKILKYTTDLIQVYCVYIWRTSLGNEKRIVVLFRGSVAAAFSHVLRAVK